VSSFTYTCDRAQKELIDLIRLVGETRVLQLTPNAGVIHQCVEKCEPCERGKGKKRCLGWRIAVDRDILWFGPVSVAGHPPIRISLSAKYSFRRPESEREDLWKEKPLASSVTTVEIFDVETDGLIERYHLDLANLDQPGSIWHLQYGGKPADDIPALPTSWLKPPRWPLPPMDLTLMVEFLVYSFFPAAWEQLNGQGEWLRLVCGAEQLIVSHFAERMSDHFGRDFSKRDRTWLMVQDNKDGDFNSRP
jgi:hypothetical protein